MPEISVRFTWEEKMQQSMKIPRGYMLLKYDVDDRHKIVKYFNALDTKQSERMLKDPENYLIENTAKIQFNTRMSTLSQKALLFSLYKIEAHELNGGESGHREQMVHDTDLYNQDLKDHCPIETIIIQRKHFIAYSEKYALIIMIRAGNRTFLTMKDMLSCSVDPEQKISMEVIRGASMQTTKETAYMINRVFNRLSYAGIEVHNPSDIKNYWLKWKQYLNDQKIVLHEDLVLTIPEYKDLHPICEACGKLIAHEGGQLSHIKSVGMGNDRTKELLRNYTSNWLHLCCECHNVFWHQEGRKKFIIRFSHLRYKVGTALKRDYGGLTV